MSHRPKFLIVLVLLAVGQLGSAQLTKAERQGITDALYIGNMTPKDLEYARRPFNDKYRLPLVNLAIDKPLDAADAIMAIHKKADQSLSGLIDTCRNEILSDSAPFKEAGATHVTDDIPGVPSDLAGVVEQLALAISSTNESIRQATSALTAEEKRLLIESLPQWAVEEPSLKFDFVKQKQADQATILRLLDKVDIAKIEAAGQLLAEKVQAAMPSLRNAAKSSALKGVIRSRYADVTIEIGGVGDDLHDSRDAMLCIDLGGHNRYTGRYGAGIGYSSVMIDMGESEFDVPDASIGVGLLGVGLAYCTGGNDTFRGRSLCFGSGLAGVGALYKEGGDDHYSSLALTQGFGEFGIGLLVDTGGSDVYQAGVYAQGAARTKGVGWLIDRAGNDIYKAGGLILNSPLFKDVYYSNAQGYGSGYREDAGGLSGGVGVLTDLHGDDTYIGETYCQAASYWYSLGSLYDAAGNDSYNAYHYAQASAMHMTAAYLFDLAGDDSYTVKYGACHAIGHDYGVAFLLDRSGDDVYAARDSHPGTGNANGVGIFLDSSGEDRYFGPPGVANSTRGSGSIGLFVDLDGPDRYSDGLNDGTAAVKNDGGIAYDAESKAVPTEQITSDLKVKPKPGSKPLPSDPEMQKLYAKAIQWGVGTAQQDVAGATDELIAIGTPALEWMLKNRLATADHLAERAFVAVVKGVGSEGRKLVAPYVASKSLEEARMALAITSDAAIKESASFLPEALKNAALQKQAARAAGVVGSRESVPDLMILAASRDRMLALAATVALGQIADEQSVSTGQSLMHSPELPIRKAAVALVAKFPDQAIAIAQRLLESPTEGDVRDGIELLARVGSEKSIALAAGYLTDPRSGVKIQAMLAVDGRCPADSRPALADLLRDSNPLVRAVAARIDPGR